MSVYMLNRILNGYLDFDITYLLNMAKIIITSDSTSDLSQDLKEKLNLHTIPLIVNLEGKEYHDGIDINTDDIYASVERTGNLPKTAALSIGEYLEFFDKVRKDENDIILHF